MLKKAMKLSTSEAMLVILLPVFGILFTQNMPLAYIVLIYVFILGVLSYYSIERHDKKIYGEKIYERRKQSHITSMNFNQFVMIQLMTFVIAVMLNRYDIQIKNGLLIYILMNTLLLMYLYHKTLLVKFYTKGVLYKGRFYRFGKLSEAILVKNYNEEYEYHTHKFHPRIVLTSDEMKLVKGLCE